MLWISSLILFLGIGGLTAWGLYHAWTGAASLTERVLIWFRRKDPRVASLVVLLGTFLMLIVVTIFQGALVQVILNSPLIILAYLGLSCLVMLCYALLVYSDLPKTRNTTQRNLLTDARRQTLDIKQASFRIQREYEDIYDSVSHIVELIQQILRYAEKEDSATEAKIRRFAAVWLDMTHSMVLRMTEYLNSPHRKNPELIEKYKDTLASLEGAFNKQIDDLSQNNWDLEAELEVIQTRIKYD